MKHYTSAEQMWEPLINSPTVIPVETGIQDF
jgi:hypothetical protein